MKGADWVKIAVLGLGIAVTWGALGARVAAVEEAVRPVPQMRTDIEVVKAAVLDMREYLKEMRNERRPR